MAANSQGAVLLALVGNGSLTVVKFLAFLVSGSGAMLSEAIHSFADTANQGLLLLGIRKSERAPDAMFPYGYGADRYFYSLMSAVGIFVLGCGVTIYHGIVGLLEPHEIHVTLLTWVVLVVALIVEGFVLFKIVKTVLGTVREKGLLTYLRHSTDPTVAAVLFEDSVAVLGVLVAAIGIALSHTLDSHVPDAMASIVIGLMMGAVAFWLAHKNRNLILGQGVPRALQREIVEFLESQGSIIRVRDFRSRVIGAERFRIKADVEFDGGALGRPLSEWVHAQAPQVASPEDAERFSEEFGSRLLEALGEEVDRIEREMGVRFPRMQFVDLEAD